MTDTSTRTAPGPVAPSAAAAVRLHPLPFGASNISGGFWGARQEANREAGIPVGSRRLREAGNLANLEAAAAQLRGESVDPASYRGPLFMDSDVYKWLEAAAWEYGRQPSDALTAEIDTFTAAIAAAQAPDGYVNSFVQVTRGGQERYRDLAMGHELYCAGHLIQAAVAVHRTSGRDGLLTVARRFADHLVETFGPDRNTGLDGHPVIETALVELYRETGEARYLDLADHFVRTRGHGTIHGHGREPIYYSDRLPVAEQTGIEGHAVRAVYLTTGAADVVAEGRDADGALAAALATQWRTMLDSKTYLTGGLGSRWDGEAFGDPYELPPDVAYAETCASIGSVQWSWRQLLATGDPAYADVVERTLFNGFVSGVSLTGTDFFYVNALQVRDGAVPDDHRQPVNGRQPWFQTACCPPNVMRTLSSLDAYLATADDTGVQLHQYAAGTVRHGDVGLTVTTDYPWDGRITVTVDTTTDSEWTLSLRVPAWCTTATVQVGDDEPAAPVPGYASLTRAWHAGDTVVLDLPMPARLSAAAPRVDAVRGCLAIERGPLVFAVEQTDQPDEVLVDDLHLATTDPAALSVEEHPELLGGCVVVHGPGRTAAGEDVTLTAVPYALWANRDIGPMRVWLPVDTSTMS